MSIFGDWNKIMEKANDNVFVDWIKTKVSEHIDQFLNDSETKRELETLIDKCNGLLQEQYGQKTYYDSLDRYVNNGRIRHDIGDSLIASGFYSTLISVFVYCDDGCRGEENFADYHLNKIREFYSIVKFDKNDIKGFFLRCYDVFKVRFAIPSAKDRAAVNSIKETVVDRIDASTKKLQDENQLLQRKVEKMQESFDKICAQGNEVKSGDVAVQESSEMKILDDNGEYRKKYQDTLFLEAEFIDQEKATLENTYVEPLVTSDNFCRFNLEKWIQDRDSRILLLQGKAGIGKTSFVSWLAFEQKNEYHILELRNYAEILSQSDPWESIKKCFGVQNDEIYENTVLILDGLDEICVLKHEFDGFKFVTNLITNLKNGFGRAIRIIITTRIGYFDDLNKNLYIKRATISWNEKSVNDWCDRYCKAHQNRVEWCYSFKREYNKLDKNDKRRDVFCSPLILYICCVSRISITKHSSIAGIYDEAFRVIGKRQYHSWNEETAKESAINRQFTKELAFQMFLNDKLDDALDSVLIELAKEKAVQWGRIMHGDEDIKPEFKKFFALNHFAFGKGDTVEFAHKTVGEYFTAIKLYEDYFEGAFNEIDKQGSKKDFAEIAENVWRSIFNAFRYKPIPVDIMNYFIELVMERKMDAWDAWRSKFFEIYYFGIEEQLLTLHIEKKQEYSATQIALMDQIKLSFRNLTWLLTGLGFNNQEFKNTKDNLKILASFLEGDVNISNWKKLDNIILTNSDLSYSIIEGAFLEKAVFCNAKLNHAKLNGAHLFFSDFKAADLSWAKLKNAECGEANFDETHLDGATFENAQMKFVSFERAYIKYTIFDGAELTGANFKNAYIVKSYFNKLATLQKAYFNNVFLENSEFIESRLEGAFFTKASLRNVTFYNACLNKAHFEHAHLDYLIFDNAKLKETNFEYSRFVEPSFVSSDLEQSRFEFAHLDQANYERANLFGSHLEKAVLEMANFKNACLQFSVLSYAIFKNAVFEETELDNAEILGACLNGNMKCVFLNEFDLPKYDEYIQNGLVQLIDPIVINTDSRKVYNPETNRMEIKEE